MMTLWTGKASLLSPGIKTTSQRVSAARKAFKPFGDDMFMNRMIEVINKTPKSEEWLIKDKKFYTESMTLPCCIDIIPPWLRVTINSLYLQYGSSMFAATELLRQRTRRKLGLQWFVRALGRFFHGWGQRSRRHKKHRWRRPVICEAKRKWKDTL